MKKKGKNIILTISLAVIVLLMNLYGIGNIEVANAAENESGKFYYIKSSGRITKYEGNESVINIPSEIDGVKIRSISYHVFLGNNSITEVNIPGSITEIWSYCFKNCLNLKRVNIALV